MTGEAKEELVLEKFRTPGRGDGTEERKHRAMESKEQPR